MSKLLVALSIVVLTSGCTALDAYSTRGAEAGAEFINGYCDNVSPAARETLRTKTNELAYPDSGEINCGPR